MKALRKEAFLSVFLLLVVLLEGGALLRHFPLRLDISRNRLSTLSPATTKVLHSLKGTVRAVLYASDNLPPALLPLRQAAEDILKEYAARSGGHFVFEVVDPLKDPEKERQARQHGVGPIQFNVMEKDELKVANGYLGLALLYADQKSAIPALTEVDNLEYEITSRILKMSQEKEKEVGLLVAQASFGRSMTMFEEYLRRTYRVRRVFPPAIPENLDLLVVVGWRTFDDSTMTKLRNFVARGKPLLVFTAATNPVDLERLWASPLPDAALDSLKALLGVGLSRHLVKDVVSDIATFQQGFQVYAVRYPYWIVVQREGLARHPVTRGLQSVVLPWASPVDTAGVEGEVTVLLSSSPRSWLASPPYNLMPGLQEKTPASFASYPLAVMVTRKDSAGEHRVALVASTNFLQNEFLSRYPENLAFAANLVDHFVFGDLLAGIRAKSATFVPLPPLSERARFWIKILNTFGMALVVALAGGVFLRRRSRGGAA